MITHVRKIDGTTIEFDKDYTLESISNLLMQKTGMVQSQTKEVATNIIDVISARDGIPSTKDFESMVNLVLKSVENAPKLGETESQGQSPQTQEPVAQEPQQTQSAVHQEPQAAEQIQAAEQTTEQVQEQQPLQSTEPVVTEAQPVQAAQVQQTEAQLQNTIAAPETSPIQAAQSSQAPEIQAAQATVETVGPTTHSPENQIANQTTEQLPQQQTAVTQAEPVQAQSQVIQPASFQEATVPLPPMQNEQTQQPAAQATQMQTSQVQQTQAPMAQEVATQAAIPVTPTLEPEPVKEPQIDIKHLNEHNVQISEQATRILEGSDNFDELGRSIFLDRYALKTKREDIQKGDLLVTISKEDPKYPKKDLGIVKEIEGQNITLHMITGVLAEKTNNYEFKTTVWKCDKPIESINDAHRRIAKAAASVETSPELQQQWEKAFYQELNKKHIQPAGRIMTAANTGEGYTKNLTLYNCYVIPSPKDSREGIIRETLHQMTEIFSRGGGVGINLSTLRPRYAYVRGVHGKSSGAVSWGGIFSYGTGLIEQGGSRRGALMLMLHDWHPDIIEFITAKRKKGVLENANISVLISDRFMEALAKGEDWPLEFPDYEADGMKEAYKTEWDGDIQKWKSKGYPTRVYKTIKTAELWNELINSAYASAEPGVVFMERYNKMSNSNYFNPIICTNPCGEQGLPAWGVCNLGHLYLASFCIETGSDHIGKTYEINWEALKQATRNLQRFLDNVIDLTPYHFEANEKNQKGERRVGLGTLGLGEMLIKLRVRYGSPESLEVID